MKTVIDLTHPISQNMPVYPGDLPVSLNQIACIEQQKFTDFRLITSMHSGTHIDGPGHMLKNGYSLSQFPIDSFCGVGILIDARNKLLSCELLQKISISPGSIILILTGYDKHFRTGCYFADHPTISQDFAQVLISHNIKMVGFDMPGPDVEPFEVHKMFFQHNIMIIENLMGLDQLVNVKYFEVYALPLKIGTDSAPARVIAVY